MWQHQIAGLDKDCKVADFRGHHSLPEMARAVLDFAPPLFSLAGHSMGGRVAFEILRLAPERVERLALLDTGIHPTRPGEAEKRQILVDLANRKGMTALARQWLPPMVHPARRDDQSLMAPLTAMVERMTPAIYAGQIRALLDRPAVADLLPTITCPTLVAVGRQDDWSPPEQHAEIARLIPGAELVIFEACGHMSTVEAPLAVTAALAKWLA